MLCKAPSYLEEEALSYLHLLTRVLLGFCSSTAFLLPGILQTHGGPRAAPVQVCPCSLCDALCTNKWNRAGVRIQRKNGTLQNQLKVHCLTNIMWLRNYIMVFFKSFCVGFWIWMCMHMPIGTCNTILCVYRMHLLLMFKNKIKNIKKNRCLVKTTYICWA